MKSTLTSLAVFATVILLGFTLGYLVASKLASDRAVEVLKAKSSASSKDLIYIITGEKP
jgi:uncharacterized BrkB/YihY/UPF0761 family membrane protein